MSTNYIPDNDATAGDPWNVAFLSDRDVSGQVPINFVPHPGIYITPACFGNGIYEDESFKECFSNLLASEFRRFVVDVYWDYANRRFNLCPVQLPQPVNGTDNAVSLASMSNTLAQFALPSSMSSMSSPALAIRQMSTANSTSTNATIISNSTVVSPTSATAAPMPTTTSPSGNTLYQLGPYQCSSSLDFDTLTSVLGDYIDASSNTIEARLQFLIVNMHAASTIQAPTEPVPSLSQSQLPGPKELISDSLDALGSIVYTPYLLQNERQNLNTSWMSRRNRDYWPLLNYFTTNRLANGDLSTPDGWPNENYVQLEQGWRVLVGYGSIDTPMNDYNFDGDNTTVFASGQLTSERNARLNNSGALTSGCFYNANDNRIDQLNSSWAVSSVINVDQSILGYAADNLTTCGISPILNFTLNGQPASNDWQPYQNFGNQALFSWAADEPKNATDAGEAADAVQWACALMVSNDQYRGHWRVADCQSKRRVACREANLPYVWRLSVDAVPWDGGPAACTGNKTFDVPRTGLENLYLYHHVRAISSDQQESSLADGVWVNFNSLDFTDCWVTTGPNGTCPYYEDPDTIRQRTILVPTIAAFITLCITALTILVKCNSNRRKSKVRKRGEGGWDYEGVPS